MYYKYNFKLIYLTYGMAIVIFIISSCLLVGYSLGYRYDSGNHKIVKTGIIRLGPIPPDCQIVYNDKQLDPQKIEKITEITDLKPGNYHVSITHPNYQNWKKNLTVNANLVTNEYEIFLLPNFPQVSKIDDNHQSDYNDSASIIAYTNQDSLWLYYPKTDKKVSYPQLKISPSTTFKWISHNLLLIINHDPQNTTIQALNPFNNNISQTTLPELIKPEQIIGSSPTQSDTVLFLSENKIYGFSLTNNQPQSLVLDDSIYSPVLNGNNLYFQTSATTSILKIKNLLLGTESTQQTNFNFDHFKIISPDLILLNNNQDTALFNINSSTIVTTYKTTIKQAKLSPDEDFLVLQSASELQRIDLKNNYSINTILRLSEEIFDFEFLNNHNIFFTTVGNLTRIDLDGQNYQLVDGLSQADILAIENKKIITNTLVGDHRVIVIVDLSD